MELIIGNTYTLEKAYWPENQGRQVVLVSLRKERTRITAYIRAAGGKKLYSAPGFDICTTDAMNLAPANAGCRCCWCCNC